jgi:hypothetical protein
MLESGPVAPVAAPLTARVFPVRLLSLANYSDVGRRLCRSGFMALYARHPGKTCRG